MRLGALLGIVVGAAAAATPMTPDRLPMTFERNVGQCPADVSFVARATGGAVLLKEDRVVMTVATTRGDEPAGAASAISLQFLGSAVGAPIAGERAAAVSRYYRGDAPPKVAPHHRDVRYRSAYDGIDVVFYGGRGGVEFDLEVAPHADADQVRLLYDGLSGITVDGNGDLTLELEQGHLVQRRPVVYETSCEGRHPLDSSFDVLSYDGRRAIVAIRVAGRDPSRPLIVDPVIDYSTTFGGTYSDSGSGIAVDAQGNMYLTGLTTSDDLPVVDAAQPSPGGNWEAFIAKLDRSGGALVYCTYLGGTADEIPEDIAVTPGGEVVVIGGTRSTDFPIRNAWQPVGGGNWDAYVAKLDAGGQLLYSTYLGGAESDGSTDLHLSASGHAVVVGTAISTDFPVVSALQPTLAGGVDLFIASFDPAGTVTYASYLGGSLDEVQPSVALDASGRIHVAAWSSSDDFPTLGPTQGARAGAWDAVLVRLASSGGSLEFSTYLGGTGDDNPADIAVDSRGTVHLCGTTTSTDFPLVQPIQPAAAGSGDFFLTRVDANAPALVMSTYLGGTAYDGAQSLAVDGAGASYLLGLTQSTDFPLVAPLQPFLAGSQDLVVSRIDRAGVLDVSTYLGGSDFDQGGEIVVENPASLYLCGSTVSDDFPVQSPLMDPPGSYQDAFLTHLTFDCTGPLQIAPAQLPDALAGVVYGVTLSASGGAPPYRFTIVDGAFPPGISMDGDGVVSGTTSVPGTYTLRVAATDAAATCGSHGYRLRVRGGASGANLVAGRGLAAPSPNRVAVLVQDGTLALGGFDAYGAGHYGVNVAAGPLRDDGRDEILTGPGPGPVFGPHVRGFEYDGSPIAAVGFFAYGTPRFGANVASVGVDGDRYAEILTGAGPSTAFGPHVRAFDFDAVRVTAIPAINYFAYATVGFGVMVASGDVDRGARDEILTGPGPSMVFGPLVRAFAFDGTLSAIHKVRFWAFPALRGGVHVAGGDVDSDGFDELLAAPGAAPDTALLPQLRGFDFDGVRVVSRPSFQVLRSLSLRYGGSVAAGDLNGATNDEVVLGYGPDPAADGSVRMYVFDARAHPMATGDAFPSVTYGVTAAIGFLGY